MTILKNLKKLVYIRRILKKTRKIKSLKKLVFLKEISSRLRKNIKTIVFCLLKT